MYVFVPFGEFEKGDLRTTASGASSFVPEACRKGVWALAHALEKSHKYKSGLKCFWANAFPIVNTAASLRYRNCEPRNRKLIQR